MVKVLSLNYSTIGFFFEDWNVHDKDWLVYSARTDRTGEFCQISVSDNWMQIDNLSTHIYVMLTILLF